MEKEKDEVFKKDRQCTLAESFSRVSGNFKITQWIAQRWENILLVNFLISMEVLIYAHNFQLTFRIF